MALTDPDITQGPISFHNGSDTVHGYLARPTAQAQAPAVLITHGNAGLPDDMCNAAAQLAQAGFVSLLLDPTSREPDPTRMAREYLMSYRYLKLLMSDLRAAHTFLSHQPFVATDGLGLLGFCGGGILNIMFAARRPEIRAVVAFYAAPRTAPQDNSAVDPRPDMLTFVSQVPAALQSHYGTADRYIPLHDVQAFAETMPSTPAVRELYLYENAAHGFYHYTYQDDYDAAAATQAQHRMLSFFKQHLAAEPRRR